MKVLDLNMSISFNEELSKEEIEEIAEDIVSDILRHKAVKGVGYDSEIRNTYSEKIPF